MAQPSVLADSSVLIQFLRGDPVIASAAHHLQRSRRLAVCGTVRQEVLQGARDLQSFARIETALARLSDLAEAPDDFTEAARIFVGLRGSGFTLPSADCLIGAVALRHNAEVWTLDKHFRSITGVRLFTP